MTGERISLPDKIGLVICLIVFSVIGLGSLLLQFDIEREKEIISIVEQTPFPEVIDTTNLKTFKHGNLIGHNATHPSYFMEICVKGGICKFIATGSTELYENTVKEMLEIQARQTIEWDINAVPDSVLITGLSDNHNTSLRIVDKTPKESSE